MSNQVTLSYQQQHPHPADEVFALLCPVEEGKWLANWEYKMIHSESGKVEPHAIFTTPHHGDENTIWYTVRHYVGERYVEFVRVTPGSLVAHITLRVIAENPTQSSTLVNYTFTGLTVQGDDEIKQKIVPNWEAGMQWWEKAINHYLSTGEKLVPAE